MKEQLDICKTNFMRSIGSEMDADTEAGYAKTLKAFDSEVWRTPKEAGVEYHYADTCFQMGALESRHVPIVVNSRVAGETRYFRLNQWLSGPPTSGLP